MGWPLRLVLNTAYAYLAEQATLEDAAAVPAYRVAQVEPKAIAAESRRAALDDWLSAPFGAAAEQEKALVSYLTS